MARKKILLLLKPLDAYPSQKFTCSSSADVSRHHKAFSHLKNRALAHKNAISFCQNILKKKHLDYKAIFRNDLDGPIRDVDLVISAGGDGTLLQASHLMDDCIPILGVNSDPTSAEEVTQWSEDFDATRSTGHLCAATVHNFEEVLDSIIVSHSEPSEVARMGIHVNSKLISVSALNDVLLAHPSPAAVSRFSFKIQRDKEASSSLVHCRSSGLRVSTPAGSTAAMLSGGGYTMPILSKELQYMVREPISPGATAHLMHGAVKVNETMSITWLCGEGFMYIDGSHVAHPFQLGDTIELSSTAPPLKIYLPSNFPSH